MGNSWAGSSQWASKRLLGRQWTKGRQELAGRQQTKGRERLPGR